MSRRSFTYLGSHDPENRAPGQVKEVWGVKFPKGKLVAFSDKTAKGKSFAKKLLALECFWEGTEPVPPDLLRDELSEEDLEELAAEKSKRVDEPSVSDLLLDAGDSEKIMEAPRLDGEPDIRPKAKTGKKGTKKVAA